MKKIKQFLRGIFAPTVYYHKTSNMTEKEEKQFDQVFKKMNETFKEMEKFFDL